jgi:hypothetical protein
LWLEKVMRGFFSFWVVPLLMILICSACEPAISPPSSPPALNPKPTFALPSVDTPNPTQPDAAGPFFHGPLSVIITDPDDNAVLTTSPVFIHGEADPGTVISLNDVLILVDAQRKFSCQVELQPGINTIEIVASDEQANEEFRFITLNLEEVETQ